MPKVYPHADRMPPAVEGGRKCGCSLGTLRDNEQEQICCTHSNGSASHKQEKRPDAKVCTRHTPKYGKFDGGR